MPKSRARKVSFKRIAKSITGISTPVFGVSWEPPKDERELVRRLVVFLEDRRALYYPMDLEYFPWVTESVQEIRKAITETLQLAPEDSNLYGPLQAMRAACRKYLDESEVQPGRTYDYRHDVHITMALGELRAACGIQLARLCSAYGVDVSVELARILPSEKD